jgi:hypothetical protein
MPTARLFLFSCRLFALHPYLFLFLTCSALCLFLFTHNTNIHAPAEFEPATPAKKQPQTVALDRSATFLFVFSSYHIHTSVSWLSWLFSVLCNTDIYDPGGIRTRNLNKRGATDARPLESTTTRQQLPYLQILLTTKQSTPNAVQQHSHVTITWLW